MHAVELLAFWKTSLRRPQEVQAMAVLYDQLVGQDPEKIEAMNELLAWVREEAVVDAEYNLDLNS